MEKAYERASGEAMMEANTSIVLALISIGSILGWIGLLARATLKELQKMNQLLSELWREE